MLQKPRMEIIKHAETITSDIECLAHALTKLLGKKITPEIIEKNKNKIVLKADCYLTYKIKGEDVTETWAFANVKPF